MAPVPASARYGCPLTSASDREYTRPPRPKEAEDHMSAIPAGPGRSTETPRDTATAGPAPHGRLRAAAAARGVPLAAILVTVAVVALTYLAGKLAYRIRDVLLMLLVAGFIALILNPLVVALQRWRIRRRGWAVAIVSVWAVLVFAGLLAAFGYPLAHGLTHLSHQLPSYVQNAEQGRGWIGHLVSHFHLEAWITRNAPKLQSLGATLARPALTVGKGALSLLATLGTIFVLIVLFLLEGPKMRQGLLKLMRPERAAYYTRVAGEISQSATGYALGNLLTSLIAGVVVFVTLTVLGVPFPLLWALWVALVDFLPMVGGALAGIPTGWLTAFRTLIFCRTRWVPRVVKHFADHGWAACPTQTSIAR